MSALTALTGFFARLAGPRPIVRPLPMLQSPINLDRPQTGLTPFSITRWALSDLEGALQFADTGNLQTAAQIWKSCKRDGVIAGVLSTRTEGLVQLPKRFEGDREITSALALDINTVIPPHELALLAGDGIGLGIGVAERVLESGSDCGILRRLDPEFLYYKWNEDRWYYRSTTGSQAIIPGNGRWVLHAPGGAVAPWQNGLWYALGRAFIAKEHAFYLRENYSQKLANAARVAYSPQGANEAVRKGFFAKLAGWGSNPVFDLPPGWDVKLLESNGRGYQVYQDIIKTSDDEAIITLAGQLVTTSGGAGFQNSNIHATIRADLIQSTADALAATLNTQVIPNWGNERFGMRGALLSPSLQWDTTPPKDQSSEVNMLNMFGQAVTSANAALAPYNVTVDAGELARRYGVPLTSNAQTPALAPAAPEAAPAPEAAATPVESSEGGEPPTNEAAAALAAKMTEHKIERCEHGGVNRCRLCGIERVRDFVIGPDGVHVWEVAWRAIA